MERGISLENSVDQPPQLTIKNDMRSYSDYDDDYQPKPKPRPNPVFRRKHNSIVGKMRYRGKDSIVPS